MVKRTRNGGGSDELFQALTVFIFTGRGGKAYGMTKNYWTELTVYIFLPGC